ncbi:DUF3189 family protein [Petroclostridium xylanilyticum]|uniref:DUF3189 family protein n=1 Tax=Petroclostridium xylanilyticum TaxID=1792311 RepID=UPI000B98F6A9|nr:DUF3189 family protein [Petroclostridium xylanilyticum]
MIIIYHCSGGSHSSVLAAHIHLGILPSDRIPNPKEIIEKTNFDTSCKKEWGLIKVVGIDDHGTVICTMGRRFSANIVIQALNSLNDILGNKGNLQLINIHTNVNLLMKIGGFLSRGCGMVAIGRPIVIKGSLDAYYNIVEVVKNVKYRLYKE